VSEPRKRKANVVERRARLEALIERDGPRSIWTELLEQLNATDDTLRRLQG
jgi:hypothetical protein